MYYLCYIYIIIYRGKTKAIRREGQSLDGLPSFPPRTRPPPSPPSGSKDKVEQKSKQKGRQRESGRRIPPPSSPLFCFVCCLHRPHHRQPLTTSPPSHQQPARDEGRQPRPVLGDVIATTSPHLAADRPTTSDHRAAPRRSAIMPASSSSPSHPSGGEEWKRKRANRTGRERTRAKDTADIFACSSLLSVAITVHAISRSSLPSSYAVPVILRHDLVRSLSSVRPSVFLFLVPRSPSCLLTAKPTPAAHYLTSSHSRQAGMVHPFRFWS